MRKPLAYSWVLAVLLGSCATDGEVAARMEREDDAKCRQIVASEGGAANERAYVQCRQNLLVYRRMAAEQREAFGDALQNAGIALGSIGR
jgi:hypothetical protein